MTPTPEIKKLMAKRLEHLGEGAKLDTLLFAGPRQKHLDAAKRCAEQIRKLVEEGKKK